MTEIYWITRLDAINGLLLMLLIVSSLGALAALMFSLIGQQRDTSWMNYEDERKEGKLLAKIFVPILVVSSICYVSIPTTKQAIVIYAVGGGLDYIKSDTTVQQLPKKVIEACDAYLDEILKNDNKE